MEMTTLPNGVKIVTESKVRAWWSVVGGEMLRPWVVGGGMGARDEDRMSGG
jgi:hypothetical protein